MRRVVRVEGIRGRGTDVEKRGGLGGDRPSVRQDGAERRGSGGKGLDMMLDVRSNGVEHGAKGADFAAATELNGTVGKEALIGPGMIEVLTGVGMRSGCRSAGAMKTETL